jgi:predicted nucleotide-binding protein (sugar kinase/HSP70/actin superfamily)
MDRENLGPSSDFRSVREKVGRFDISGNTVLMPEMSPFTARLTVAALKAYGVPAVIMETYRGLALGKEFSSGKECFPCQVTLGDVLHHLEVEKERLGSSFSAGRYVYFMPESTGPCRFGMYGKMQRLVLDRFPAFKDIRISSLTSENAYATDGLLPGRHAGSFKKLAYVVSVIADSFDRIVWRVRPYEKIPGSTDACMDEALETMTKAIEERGVELDLKPLLHLVEETARTLSSLMDRRLPRRPRIGVIGEIYLRTHPDSNQHIARQIEEYGGEVVITSIAEWFNYVAYDRARRLCRRWTGEMQRGKVRASASSFRKWLGQKIEEIYLHHRQRQIYAQVLKHLDIQPDHRTRAIEKRLDDNRHFCLDIGTEAVLSIGAALEFVHEGFNGIVNVYPFTCMPGATSSAILNPLLNEKGVPFFEAPCDETTQPNREAALRTFVYQARQHLERQERGNGQG